MVPFLPATSRQRRGALAVWRAAKAATGDPPPEARIERVREKLADGTACLLVGCEADRVVAMALAEPYREEHGAGPIRLDAGHVSMVFVDPERWSEGLGGRLLDALHSEMWARGWETSSVWTRSTNTRARRLYESREYRLTRDAQRLRGEHEIVRYELQLDGPVTTTDAGDALRPTGSGRRRAQRPRLDSNQRTSD